MKFIDANFIFSSSKPNDFPKTDLPEYAFAGRSNVGKSSFINSIVLRKNLARISSNPGKTKALNFYSIEERYILADMPGYGYAKISKKDREDWKTMISSYIMNRKNLRFVTVLIDSRHAPMPIDLSFVEWLENSQVKYLITLTKSDKITKLQIEERIVEWKSILQNCQNNIDVIATSSENGMGRETFLGILKKYL